MKLHAVHSFLPSCLPVMVWESTLCYQWLAPFVLQSNVDIHVDVHASPFTSFPISGHRDGFQRGAVNEQCWCELLCTSCVATNAFTSLGQIRKRAIIVLYGRCMFNCLRNCQTIFQNVWTMFKQHRTFLNTTCNTFFCNFQCNKSISEYPEILATRVKYW